LFYAGHLTVDFVKENLYLCKENVVLMKNHFLGEDTTYVPVLLNNPCECKKEDIKGNDKCRKCGNRVYQVLDDGSIIESRYLERFQSKHKTSGSKYSGEQSLVIHP
jgi:hypothetical protein